MVKGESQTKTQFVGKAANGVAVQYLYGEQVQVKIEVGAERSTALESVQITHFFEKNQTAFLLASSTK